MDESSLARDLNLKSVHLMNDLEAVARAVPVLRALDLLTLNKGEAVLNGPSQSSRRGRVWVNPFSPGMTHSMWRTAPRVGTVISRRQRSGKFVCLSTCCRVSVTSESSVSVPESAFPTFTNIFAMKRKKRKGPKLLNRSRPSKQIRQES